MDELAFGVNGVSVDESTNEIRSRQKTTITIETIGGAEETIELSVGESAEIAQDRAVVTVTHDFDYDEVFWKNKPTDPEELAKFVGNGMSRQEIADTIGVVPTTVGRYLDRCGL